MWVVSSYSLYDKAGKIFYLQWQHSLHLQMFMFIIYIYICNRILLLIFIDQIPCRGILRIYCLIVFWKYILFWKLIQLVGSHVNVYEKNCYGSDSISIVLILGKWPSYLYISLFYCTIINPRIFFYKKNLLYL